MSPVARAAAAAALCLSPSAFAQVDEGSQNPAPLGYDAAISGPGLALSIQVSVVFDCAGPGVSVLRTHLSDRAFGENATSDYVFAGLNQAAMLGLDHARASGARTGRADVVAVAYQIGGDGASISTWAPVGLFVNTTEMALDEFDQPHYQTHVEFIPDRSMIEIRRVD